MTEPTSSPRTSWRERLGHLPPAMLAIVGVAIVLVVGSGSYYAYRTYDYVQHDNEFCLSCHLMQDPYQRFAQSAHQGLGCKACHRPNLIQRSEMGLTAILENPDSLSKHAEVPNETCAECHIQGDPEKWRVIANSVGHKVHFESDDPSLQGLQCVECHSTSLHQFAPIDATCAQSGCHEDKKIQLGAMSDLTIHCAACHNFVAPVTDRQGILASQTDEAILPNESECLSCHEMRMLVELPRPDPHKGDCAACHNPHTQSDPAQAAGSCTKAGCHTSPQDLTPFHRGLPDGTLSDCMSCHEAHDFALDGSDCASCHQGPPPDGPASTASSEGGGERPHEAVRTAGLVHGGVDPASRPGAPDAAGIVRLASLIIGDRLPSTEAPPPAALPAAIQVAGAAAQVDEFSHKRHEGVPCQRCHSSTNSHGAVTVRTIDDCRGCHHTAPLAGTCQRCHTSADAPDRTYRVVRSVSFSVGTTDPSRSMTFPHADHANLNCAECHQDGLALAPPPTLDCDRCHQQHHTPETNCAACHRPAPASAHPPTVAHVTCSGSGCHQSLPFEGVPRTRAFCLGCHQDRTDHEPGRACADCHVLPPPRGAQGP